MRGSRTRWNGLIAWTADLARIAAGDAARQNPDAASAAAGASRRGWRPSRCFAIIGRCFSQRAMLAHPLQPRLVAEAMLLGLPGPVLNDGGKPNRSVPCLAPRWRRAGARPGVLSLNIRERAALYAAYMPFLKGGGIFIPTSRQYQLGEEVFMLLSLMDDPNRIAVQGKVVWITPEGVQGNRTQGIGVQFTQDETGANGALDHRADPGRDAGAPSARRIRCSGHAALVAGGARLRRSPCGIRPASAFEITDVRRFPLSSRFPRIRRRSCRGCSTPWPAASVTHALCIGVNLPDWPAVHALAVAHPNLYATVGVHPDAETRPSPRSMASLTLRARPKVVAIGETGLDYYRLEGDLEWQRERFRVHIRAALRARMPLVIHTRAASADTIALMQAGERARCGRRDALLHGNLGRRAGRARLGFHISLSGIVTFKNAHDVKDVARRVPLDRLLIETDAPYLAPVPFRGKRNQPAYVPHVAAEDSRSCAACRPRTSRGDDGELLPAASESTPRGVLVSTDTAARR